MKNMNLCILLYRHFKVVLLHVKKANISYEGYIIFFHKCYSNHNKKHQKYSVLLEKNFFFTLIIVFVSKCYKISKRYLGFNFDATYFMFNVLETVDPPLNDVRAIFQFHSLKKSYAIIRYHTPKSRG